MTKISTLPAQCSQVDSDGSGSIEFLEFLLLMGRILKDVPTDADLRDVFTGKLNRKNQGGPEPGAGSGERDEIMSLLMEVRAETDQH